MKKFRFQWGAFLMFILYGGLFFILFGRLLFIQITGQAEGRTLAEEASKNYARSSILAADRGSIMDRNGEMIATDTLSYRLIAVLDEEQSDSKTPRHVDDPEKTAKALAKHIDIKESELVKRLTRTEQDIKEKRKKQVEFGKAGNGLNYETMLAIKEEKLSGILFAEEKKRFYPNGIFASYLIGFTQQEEVDGELKTVGKMGLELFFDEILNGTNGEVKFQADRWGFMLPRSEKAVVAAKDGFNIQLTIDKTIQNFVEDALNEVQLEYEPEKMVVVVADPKTGEVLAMGQRPAFDPYTREGLTSNWLNGAVENTIEPGSTMKIFTLAAAIEENKWNPNAYFTSGQYKIFDRIIRDHNRVGWGDITYLEGFQRSSNVSMAYLLESLGDREFIEYINKFGFGEKTNIDLPREAAGVILDNFPSERLTTSYGQGSTVTPIQMIQAATAIANDGVMMKPYVIKEIKDPNTDKIIQQHEPEQKGSPISKDTAEKVRKVLATTITSEVGTGRRFALDGYTVGGKTGTAEIPNGQGGYHSGNANYLFSFIGMAPIEDPQLLTYVFVQHPKLKQGEAGSDPVAKIFKPIMENGLKYRNIAPDVEAPIEAASIEDYTGKDALIAQQELEEAGYMPVILGEEGPVNVQYPEKGAKLSPQSVVLLKTEGQITLPDFTGWSKKMVLSFKMLSGFDIEISGEGYVTEQSLPEGLVAEQDATIVLQLKRPSEIYPINDGAVQEEQQQEEAGIDE